MKYTIVVPAFLLLLSLSLSSCKDQAESKMPPPRVQVVEAIQMDIPIEEEFVGQTYGLFDISIQARVEGFLETIHFEEGRRVNKGQLLYTLDAQPFEAKVAGYQSQLAEANTMLSKAESDLARIRPLAEINAVSQSDLDAALAQRDAAQAGVEAAEAMLRAARIELGYTRIYSPIDGVIGKTEAFPGDFVGRGSDAVLNEVSRIDKILVNFFLPEEKYLELTRGFLESSQPVTGEVDQDGPGLSLFLADGSQYPYKGKVEFINRQVDASTGTILLQASFPNPQSVLRPGQFARVRAVIDTREGGILVPQRCVTEIQGTFQVYVVGSDNKVEFRSIEVGPVHDTEYWIVESGLEPGEKIIYEGLLQVRSGIEVVPELKELNLTVKDQ